MKKLILLLAAAMSINAVAKPVTCNEVTDMAKTIMEARQSGVPADLIVSASKNNEAVINMVTMAYNVPRFNAEVYQERAVTEFGSRVYLICMGTALRKNK